MALQIEGKQGLTEPQRRLLREMATVRPEERKTLRELLYTKSFFRAGEDTEQAKHVEVLAPLEPSRSYTPLSYTPFSPSHTLTHPHTPSHTLTHTSHTLTHPHTPTRPLNPPCILSGARALLEPA